MHGDLHFWLLVLTVRSNLWLSHFPDAAGNAVVGSVQEPAAGAGVRPRSVFMLVEGTPVTGRGRAGVVAALQQLGGQSTVDFMFAAPSV